MNTQKISNQKPTRNSSIELLRIITMIGVIILHYNNGDIAGGFRYVTNGTINQHYLFLTENLFICAVNLFVMISAYFLSCTQERKLIKIVDLIIQVMVFRCAFYLMGAFVGGNVFSIKGLLLNLLPANYFVILYSALYLISPYINIFLQKVSTETFKKLIITLVLLFSVWTFLVDLIEQLSGSSIIGLSTVGMYGSQYGYTIVNFLVIYFIGAYIRLNNVTLSTKTASVTIVLLLVLLYGLSIAEHLFGIGSPTTWNYNNPIIIFMAAAVLLLFKNIQFKNRVINELAKGAFTCFLFHGAFMNYLMIESIANKNICILIVHQIGVAVALYLISYIVYKIYYLCSHWFIQLITPLCNKLNVSVINNK